LMEGSSGALFVARTADRHAILTHQGQPVWPVCEATDWQALSSLAALLGVPIILVDQTSYQQSPGPVEIGFVAAADPGHLSLAALYAHLTQRAVSGLWDPSAARPDILILDACKVDAGLLDTLHRWSCEGHACGIVTGSDDKDLTRRVLLLAAHVRLKANRDLVDRSYFPGLAMDNASAPDREIWGRTGVVEGLRKNQGTMSDLTSILTHGDGTDFSLGNGALCDVLNRVDALPDTNAPSCVLRRHCYRLDLPLDEARLSGRLFDATDIGARILWLATCWGISPEPSVISGEWSFVGALQRAPLIGAIVTSWKVALVRPRHVERFIELVRCCPSVGLAVTIFNAEEQARRSGVGLCIVGDPAIAHLARVPELTLLPLDEAYCSVPRSEFSETSFLRAYIALGEAQADDRFERLIEDAAAALPVLEGGIDDDGLINAAGAIARLAASRGSLFLRGWLPLVATEPVVIASLTCPCCHAASEVFAVTLALRDVARRHFVNCPRCGVIEDYQDEADRCGIGLQGNTIELHCPKGTLSAYLLLESDWREEREVIKVPGERLGDGPCRMSIPDHRRQGFHYIALFAMGPGRISSARVPTYLQRS
jgi:hypothetical protein